MSRFIFVTGNGIGLNLFLFYRIECWKVFNKIQSSIRVVYSPPKHAYVTFLRKCRRSTESGQPRRRFCTMKVADRGWKRVENEIAVLHKMFSVDLRLINPCRVIAISRIEWERERMLRGVRRQSRTVYTAPRRPGLPTASDTSSQTLEFYCTFAVTCIRRVVKRFLSLNTPRRRPVKRTDRV